MQYEVSRFKDFYMYFDALADLLDNMEPPVTIKEKVFCNSYMWIKDLSRLDRQQTIKIMKSALDLLSRHMNLFQNLLYPDCMYWHDVLLRLSFGNITEYGICGQRALKKFYEIVGQILTNQNSDEGKLATTVRYYIRYTERFNFLFTKEEMHYI